MDTPSTYTAFEGNNRLFSGPLDDVIIKIKKKLGKAENSSFLIFSDSTGKTMDFNFHGTEKEILKRLEIFVSNDGPKDSIGPGRPKLGVTSREVSLLPRHWEWLATQSGGASATLRKLVEEAKKASLGSNHTKQAQERTYSFISVMAGDLQNFEEALRALYKKDEKKFVAYINDWPIDVQRYALELSQPVFKNN